MTALEDFKYWFQAHLTDLKAQCPDEPTRQQLLGLFVKTCEAYEQSINKILEPGNETAARLTGQLSDIQEQVDHAIERQEDIAAVIDKISIGTGIAVKLAGLFIPALKG